MTHIKSLIYQLERDAIAHCMARHGSSAIVIAQMEGRRILSRAALVTAITDENVKLRADIERIGRERDDMERANKEQAAEIARLNAIIAGMATLPATSEPRS